MTRRPELPEIPPSALRNVGTEERIDRVWGRVQADLGPAPRGRGIPESMLWVPTAAVVVFGAFVAGVSVGRAFPPPVAPDVTVVKQERIDTIEPAGPGREPEVVPPPTPPKEVRVRHRQQRLRAAAEVVVVQPEGVVAEPGPVPPVALPEWYRLWQEDEYQKAREAIERHGGFETLLAQAPADQAMAMVDLARFSHENALAIAALRRVVERFPDDPNAPIAAMTLGNMLERAGDTQGAAEAFQAYRALSPKGDFAEDTLARQIEVAIEQRDLARANELVAQYEAEFPNGGRVIELRDQLRAAEEAAGVDEPDEPSVDEREEPEAATMPAPPLSGPR